jgi:predicted DsbA family dithiol-disulfide isomerase
LPFDLHPEYPPEGIPREELERRYGAGFHQRLFAMFEAAGLPHAEQIDRVPNSRRALVLGEYAREQGRFDEVHRRLFRAYWAEGRDIGTDEVLLDVAAQAGLDPAEAAARLDDPSLLRIVDEQTTQVMEHGAGGVPAWAIDERVLVPGAQPHEVFERVLERLGHAPVGD